MPATVRIEAAAHAALSAIARAKQLSLTEALSRAVEAYRREVFVADLAGDFAALRADSAAWAEETLERTQWDRVSSDGLPEERVDGRGPSRAKKKSSARLTGKKRRRG